MRDDVARVESESRHPSADRLEGVCDGAHHEVGRVAGHLVRTLPADEDLQAVVIERGHHELVVDAEREAQRVEARTQVRAGRGNPHRDGAALRGRRGFGHAFAPTAFRPRTDATSEVVASTTVGSTWLPSALRRAHCGSLRP